MPGKSRYQPARYKVKVPDNFTAVSLESPVIFNPGIFPGNLPGNLREAIFCCIKTRWPPEAISVTKMAWGTCTWQRPRAYQERTILDKIEEREIIERYWLSREVINSFADEFTGGDLSRDTIHQLYTAREVVCCPRKHR